MKVLEGNILAQGQRIGIVAGRFNEFITSKLLGGAIDAIKRHGGSEENITIFNELAVYILSQQPNNKRYSEEVALYTTTLPALLTYG